MKVIGLNPFGHDTSAALVADGHLVSAVAEERLSRVKHDRSFPIKSVEALLAKHDLTIKDVDAIGINLDINYHIEQFYYNLDYPISKDGEQSERIKPLISLKSEIRNMLLFDGPIVEHRHHLCHLRATQYQSSFDKALLCSFDGMGEINSGSIAIFDNQVISSYREFDPFPHSIGLLYSAITDYLGWLHHCDEGIIMGLAPYGDPQSLIPTYPSKSYSDVFRDMIQLDSNYSTRINLSYFDYHNRRNTWVSEKFISIFGNKRVKNTNITDHHRNIAAALQTRVEELIYEKLKTYKNLNPEISNLCLSGGFSLNCSNNGKLRASGLFDQIFVQPASADDGTAIGAALLTSDIQNNKQITSKPQSSSAAYLGPSYNTSDYQRACSEFGLTYIQTSDLNDHLVNLLLENRIIGWFSGCSEFGPRALCHRSILAMASPASNKDLINDKIKFRESFRPFAPVTTLEDSSTYFDMSGYSSPHMLFATSATVQGVSDCPAVVHIDKSARVQTVTQSQNNKIYSLLSELKFRNMTPVLLNTSFNVKGQPIVETPHDAISTFLNTAIEALVLENCLILKDNGKPVVVS